MVILSRCFVSQLIYNRTIVETLSARYRVESYGLGNAETSFPTWVFVTHLVHLRGGLVNVDVKAVAVSALILFLI